MAELDIMTDNLRNMDTLVTPSTKKSFAAFHPEDYNLREGLEKVQNNVIKQRLILFTVRGKLESSSILNAIKVWNCKWI